MTSSRLMAYVAEISWYSSLSAFAFDGRFLSSFHLFSFIFCHSNMNNTQY